MAEDDVERQVEKPGAAERGVHAIFYIAYVVTPENGGGEDRRQREEGVRWMTSGLTGGVLFPGVGSFSPT